MKKFLPARFPTLCASGCLLLSLIVPLAACDGALTFLAGESKASGLAASNWSGTGASVSNASFVTARTEAEWQSLWQTTGQPVPGKLPERKMAVAVFLGQRFDAGARVEIYNAEIRRRIGEPEHAVVGYRELTMPGVEVTGAGVPGEGSSGSVISPWAVRLMDRSVLEPDYQRAGS